MSPDTVKVFVHLEIKDTERRAITISRSPVIRISGSLHSMVTKTKLHDAYDFEPKGQVEAARLHTLTNVNKRKSFEKAIRNTTEEEKGLGQQGMERVRRK